MKARYNSKGEVKEPTPEDNFLSNKQNLEYQQAKTGQEWAQEAERLQKEVEQLQQSNKELREGIKAVLNKWNLGAAGMILRRLLKQTK